MDCLFLLATLALAPGASSQSTRSHEGTQLYPSTPFLARAGFPSAYDPISKKIIVFGGTDGRTQFNDTWTFDGTTRTQIDHHNFQTARRCHHGL